MFELLQNGKRFVITDVFQCDFLKQAVLNCIFGIHNGNPRTTKGQGAVDTRIKNMLVEGSSKHTPNWPLRSSWLNSTKPNSSVLYWLQCLFQSNINHISENQSDNDIIVLLRIHVDKRQLCKCLVAKKNKLQLVLFTTIYLANHNLFIFR